MVENQAIIDNINSLFTSAQEHHRQMLSALEQAVDELDSNDSVVVLEAHRLTLQLRLDTQDVIRHLLAFNQGYCQAIGIEPFNSDKLNLERVLANLEKGKLTQSLSLLIGLIDQLRQTVLTSKKSLEQQQKEFKKLRRLLSRLGTIKTFKRMGSSLKEQASPELGFKLTQNRALCRLEEAIDIQAQLSHCVEILTESIAVIVGSPKTGVVYDYICQLKGPISRFYQAVLNGVGTLEALHQWCLLKSHARQPEVALNQLHHQYTNQLVQITQLQSQLSQQTRQNIQLLHSLQQQLNQNLSQSQQHNLTPMPQLEQASTARRMLDLFNRK